VKEVEWTETALEHMAALDKGNRPTVSASGRALRRLTCSAISTSKRGATTTAKDTNDGQRFDLGVRQIVGKPLTFDQLTGKTAEAQA